MFDLTIISARKIVFDDTVERVRVSGDESEYEFLEFHAKCIGCLTKGVILINEKFMIPIQRGIVKFENNKCVILAEEIPDQAEKDEAKMRKQQTK